MLKDKYKSVFPYIFIFIFVISIYYPVFIEGYITTSDNPLHLYKTYFLIEHIIPEQKWINGWCSWDCAGYDIFSGYPPLIYFLIAIVHYISGISIEISYKIVFILIYFLTGSGIYYCLKDRGNRLLAFMSSIIFLLCPLFYSMHVYGFLGYIFSVALFMFLFRSIEDFHKDMTWFNLLKSALLLSAIMSCHMLSLSASFIFLLSSLIVKLLTDKKKKDVLLKYLAIGLIAIFINLYYFTNLINTYLIFASFKTIGSPPEYGTYPISYLLWEVLNFKFTWQNNTDFLVNLYNNLTPLLFFLVDLLGIMGIIYYIKYDIKKDYNSFRTVLIIFSTGIIFLHSLCYLPKNLQILFLKQEFLSARMMVFVLFVILYFLSDIFNKIKRSNLRKGLYILLIILTVFEVFKKIYVAENSLSMFNKIPASQNLEHLWTWIGENINKSEGPVVYQDTYFSGKPEDPFFFSHIMTLSAKKTGIPQFISLHASESPCTMARQVFMENNCIFGIPVDMMKDGQLYKFMNLVNARYIVSCEEKLQSKLSDSDLFILIKSYPPFTIFVLKNKEQIKLYEFSVSGTECEITELKDNHMVFNIKNPVSDNLMLLKITWHPYWKAFINKKEVFISRSQFGMMEITLPEKGNIQIELRYNSFNPLTVFISLFFLLFSIAGFIYFYVRLLKERHDPALTEKSPFTK